MPNVATHLQNGLAADQLKFLQDAGAIASRMGAPLYLVGGSVRDLLLNRPLLDLDLVAEGDVSALVTKLAHDLGGEAGARSQFDTFKLKLATGAVDIATARTETYAQPGALPTVKPGSLVDDLVRRDFTINALAVNLSPEKFGALVDAHGGERDLQDKLIRVLHDASFQDDATRILRGIRYEQRLGFHLEANTENLVKRHLRYLTFISPDRLHRELERCLAEQEPELCMARMQELGVLNAIVPGLAWSSELRHSLNATRASGQEITPLMFLSLLVWPLTQELAEALAKRLNLSSRVHKVVRDTMLIKSALSRLSAPDLPPSGAYALLKEREVEAIQTALLASDANVVRERLKRFLSEWQHFKPNLSAQRLMDMGVPEGPLVGKLLGELHAYRLDNADATPAQEESLVRRRMRELTSESKG